VKLGYQPALDGLRGISIAIVVVSHTSGGWPHAGLGVDIFFVLSGFLITTLLLEEWEATGSISRRAFYRRRALRLLPALLAGLLAFVAITIVAGAFGVATSTVPRALVGALVSASYFANFVQPALPEALRHLWSLALEEQFYLFWPIALAACLIRGLTPRRIALILAGAVALIAAHRLALTLSTSGPATVRLYYFPDVRFDSVLVGAFAACALRGWPQARSERLLRLWPLAVLVGVALVTLTNPNMLAVPGGLVLVFTISAALVILRVVTAPTSRLTRALSFRPLVYLGGISYGLYVWHLILMHSTTVVPPLPGALLSVAVAAVSYQLIELPFLRKKARSAPAPATAGRRRGTRAVAGAPPLTTSTAAAPSTTPG